MPTKKLLNHSEYRTLQSLDRSLPGLDYRVLIKVRLTDVLTFDSSIALTKSEKNFLMTSHLDFLVCNTVDYSPHFALEFDGPMHIDPVQANRDITKNRLCRLAGLPLLRVSDLELRRHDTASLVEFMVGRFVAWTSTDEASYSEPDGRFQFNLDHPFPGLNALARKLLSEYGISTDYLKNSERRLINFSGPVLEAWVMPAGMSFEEDLVTVRHGCGVYRKLRQSPTQRYVGGMLTGEDAQVLFKKQVTYRMRWTLPLLPDYNPQEIPATYFMRTGKMPIHFQEIPGVHIPDIAEHLSEYLCLREIEKWATRNKGALTRRCS